ncbi:hypothetical protein SAMN05216324_102432 [Chryseobacterium limigenitum]|uniref:Uncharacterized protein n=1 Tax=Chryseobacterium limigenitum TaxID=1612149 RepID=A0A1K2IH98_9FLAO|nr:hypothetical protein SAMN05216324_102432 [Chryseobacterium limigenitum]
MNRQDHSVFVLTVFIIVHKTSCIDIVHFQPKSFYQSYRKADQVRQSLIQSGKLSEDGSSVEGERFMVLHMN